MVNSVVIKTVGSHHIVLEYETNRPPSIYGLWLVMALYLATALICSAIFYDNQNMAWVLVGVSVVGFVVHVFSYVKNTKNRCVYSIWACGFGDIIVEKTGDDEKDQRNICAASSKIEEKILESISIENKLKSIASKCK